MSGMMMMMMMMMTLMAGINLRTGDKGIFPLAHVVDVDYNDFDPAGVEVTVNNNIASSVTVPVFILICPRSRRRRRDTCLTIWEVSNALKREWKSLFR